MLRKKRKTNSAFYKSDSHRMMEIMWGIGEKGNKSAYCWLHKQLDYPIHFSTAKEEEAKEAHKLLYDRMIRKGFDYETGARKPKPIKKQNTGSKKKKVNFVAKNVFELQKRHKQSRFKIVIHRWFAKILSVYYYYIQRAFRRQE